MSYLQQKAVQCIALGGETCALVSNSYEYFSVTRKSGSRDEQFGFRERMERAVNQWRAHSELTSDRSSGPSVRRLEL